MRFTVWFGTSEFASVQFCLAWFRFQLQFSILSEVGGIIIIVVPPLLL